MKDSKDGDDAKCEVAELLKAHRSDFKGFTERWSEQEHKLDGVKTKVDIIHETVTSIGANMHHLNQLPVIATALASIDRNSSAQVASLIMQAGDSSKSNSRLVEKMLFVCLAVVVLLGVALLVAGIKDADKDLQLDRNGVNISRHRDSPPAADLGDIKKIPGPAK